MSNEQNNDIKILGPRCFLTIEDAMVRTYSFEDVTVIDMVLAYLKAICSLLEREKQKARCANYPKRKKESRL